MDCCEKDGSCGTQAGQAECCGSKCPCGGECGGDPCACAKELWCSSFRQALKEVHVEALKERIRKAWGPNIDKGADAVVEAMGTVWQSLLSAAKAKSDLQEKMQGIMFGGKK